jgi:uncharacterized protein (DUF2252 family)
VRGSTVKFYEWLEQSSGKVPDGPPVWICGDCHLGNLGPLADAKGRVSVQIRDLDQTVIARLLDTGVVLRELTPQDLKIEVEHLAQDEAAELAGYLAGVVGRAYGRQMDSATREAWRGVLSSAHTATLKAPTWLWSSIVELLSIHEAAYLDHCRRFALEAAA